MPIDNPTALVEAFKKSGEFERLRRELLMQFQQDESYTGLKARVEATGRERLAVNPTLRYMPPETIQEDLTQELQRHPMVERAVADARIFSDPTFLASTKSSIKKILDDERGGISGMPKNPGKGTAPTPSDGKQQEMDSAQAGLNRQKDSAIDSTPTVISSISSGSKLSVEPLRLSSTPPSLASASTPQAPLTSANLESGRLNTSSQNSMLESSPGVPPPGDTDVNATIADPQTTDIEMKVIRPGD